MAKYEFACPVCESAFRVDAIVRGDLIEAGCLRCGASVTAADFTLLSAHAPAE